MLNINRIYSLILIPLVALFTLVTPIGMEALASSGNGSVLDKYGNDSEKTKDGNQENSKENTKDNQTNNVSLTNNENEDSSKQLIILLFQLVFYTIIVVLMIYGLVKFLSVRQKKLQQNNIFNVLGGVSVGNQKSLQLVKVANKVYFIGVGEDVTLLKEINDETEISNLEAEIEAKQTSPIANQINRLLNKQGEKAESNTDFRSFQNLMKQTMEKQKEKRNSIEQKLKNSNDKDEK
jgi:flagellar protein FliO/FliZ